MIPLCSSHEIYAQYEAQADCVSYLQFSTDFDEMWNMRAILEYRNYFLVCICIAFT
jgi:hypothetical protein